MLGVGAGVATGTSVGYTLDGYAYRTFTAPLPQVEGATRTALKSANQNMTTASVSSTGSQSASSSSGIVSGSGKSHGNSGQEVSGQTGRGKVSLVAPVGRRLAAMLTERTLCWDQVKRLVETVASQPLAVTGTLLAKERASRG
jgi:hypothetical protein